MQIISVASGKGGVGKSLISANLAIALAKAGKTVVVADMDLGASNLHLALGFPSAKIGMGTFLTGQSKFEEIIQQTDYENVYFIPGDSEIPGLSSIKASQKNSIIRRFKNLDTDYLILDLGAGTHLSILDFFLMSPQGIIVTSPTVTATLNGYLFLKNTVFRLMQNSFKRGSKAANILTDLKKDSTSLQRLYIPKLAEKIRQIDPENAQVFYDQMEQFQPRLIMNMIDEPTDADKAYKIRRSCREYLGLDLEFLGVIYKDSLQDVALSSRLPITVYKPQSLLSQAIFRIADKILVSETKSFNDSIMTSDESFQTAEAEALEDFENKMSYIEDLLGTGALSMSDLAETIKSQQYEITQLRKENLLYKSKLIKAASQGFKI
ncbi:MAG: MinD/ParA family protein [Treponema sp.]|nr:MinD/ParA family protein [Treponema sp.]